MHVEFDGISSTLRKHNFCVKTFKKMPYDKNSVLGDLGKTPEIENFFALSRML